MAPGEEIKCPYCGASNNPARATCQRCKESLATPPRRQGMPLGLRILALLILIAFLGSFIVPIFRQ